LSEYTIKAVYERPDVLMEKAKQLAENTPDQEIAVRLNDKEIFLVTYNSKSDEFECTREIKLS
jgi:hypothetical protein